MISSSENKRLCNLFISPSRSATILAVVIMMTILAISLGCTGKSWKSNQRSVPAVKNYWQSMIFSGRGTPPPEAQLPDQVLAFVRADPGAVGYVPADTELGEGVKVLAVNGS